MAAKSKKLVAGKWKEPMGKLHVLLAKAFPEHRTATYDVLDIEWLAGKMKVTEESIYNWLRNDAIPFVRAEQLVKIRGCRIELEDLLPYISRSVPKSAKG